MMKMRIAAAGAAAAITAAVLVACGGDSSGQAAQVAGVVLDGSGTQQVFLDLNQNQRADADEPSTPVSADGSFVLPIGKRSAGEIASALLVASGSGGASTLMAPASAFITFDGAKQKTSPAVISPLTTLAAAGVVVNGLTGSEAAELVQSHLGLDKTPLTNYQSSPDRVLQSLARGAATALTAAADGASNPVEAADRAAKAMPALSQQFNLAQGGTISVNAARGSLPLPPQAAAAGDAVRFMVKFKEAVSDPQQLAAGLVAGSGTQLLASYSNVVKGAAVSVPTAQASAFLQATAANPGVELIELDQRVTTMGSQSNAPWGLDRIDQRALPLNKTFSYANDGAGVRAYVVDTGIRASHAEFGGRVAAGYTAIADGQGTNDCNGHGTHVAGTIGGSTYGVAKGVTLVPVRVLDCSGSGWTSDIVAALDWMVTNVQKPAVANMSLGGGASVMLDDAVMRAINAGIPVIVAAGNSAANACNYSPARVPAALTVGASTSIDGAATFSNFGSCVDVFAPGQSISSAWNTGDTASAVLNGTSMAAPHAAGVAALYLFSNPTATVDQTFIAIRSGATASRITTFLPGTTRSVLYAALSGAVSPPPQISNPISDTISNPPQPNLRMSVASLTPAPVKTASMFGTYWQAKVIVAVRDQNGNLVSGAVVQGSFTQGGSAPPCTTGSNGTCVLTGGTLPLTIASSIFSIGTVSRSSAVYDAAANVVSKVNVVQP